MLAPSHAYAHPATPPPPVTDPTPQLEKIPAEDEGQYHSYVTAIKPRVPGLRARIIGGQDKLAVTWTGQQPLVVLGVEGEPMLRMSSRGIETNENSPSAYLSAERYARVSVPVTASPRATPSWRLIDTPGPISWYEHRAQWMEASRPPVVENGSVGLTIFHWKIPARLGKRDIQIQGALDWRPDPGAIRAQRSDVSSPLLSALILAVAMGFGALMGVYVRGRGRFGVGQARSSE